MSKSKRRKVADAAFKARVGRLRESGLGISIEGRDLQPGSPEYERELKLLLLSTSPDELVRRSPKAGS